MGGYFGAELKRAGFDAVIVEGVSPKPVYLWIKDGAGRAARRDPSVGQDDQGDAETLCARNWATSA